jgi:hypothetical protein
VIVLVDGDAEGDLAKDLLLEGIRKGKDKKPTRLIDPSFIVQLSSADLPNISTGRPGGPQDIEDLIPLSILHRAATTLSEELFGPGEPTPGIEVIRASLSDECGHFKALTRAFESAGSPLRIDKLGLARAVIDHVDRNDAGSETDTLRANFTHLFRKLRALQHEAEAERRAMGAQTHVRRAILSFLKQYPDRATRDDVRVLLLDLDRLLDDSAWADLVRVAKLAAEREFKLTSDLGSDIANYPMVRRKLEGLLYAADVPSASQEEAPAASQTTAIPEVVQTAPVEQTEPETTF